MFRRLKEFLKSFLPRTLFWRTLIILVTPIFLVQIITTYMFFDRHWQKMGDRMAFAIAGEIALISDQIEKDDRPATILKIQEATEQTLDLSLLYEHDAKLTTVYEDPRPGFQNPSRENIIAQTLAKAFYKQVMRPFDVARDPNGNWVQARIQLDKGVLIVTLPERRIFSSSGYVVLLWMVGSSIVLLMISTIFMRNQIRPIMRLAVAAERIGKGREVPFFKIEGAREVRTAARAFVDMKDRLQRQIHQRTAMLAGVSHDLRTPLTRMKLQLAMMQGPDVQDLKSDLADMERMIEAYLQFARGDGNEEPVRTDLKDLIEQTARNTNREGQRVFTDCPDDLTLLLRPVAFARCLENVVGNALKYGAQAWVSARRFGDVIEICVDDNGPGIPPESYDDVFRPFYRIETSRNSKTGGVGLGLPIVQDIVLSHGGRVWLDKSPQGGLRVVMDLPV